MTGWGALPEAWEVWQGEESQRPVQKILEVFLYGGLSAWESFYWKGTGVGPWIHFRTEFEAELRANGIGAFSAPFVDDVSLGPAAFPLWASLPAEPLPSLVDRLRVLVMAHDLMPHQAAIPYAFTGSRLGRPTLSGTGAAVMRRYSAAELPAAYLLMPDGGNVLAGDNLISVLATGAHGSACTPLQFKVGCAAPNFAMLERPIDPKASALLDHYVSAYEARLRPRDACAPVRSRAFADFRTSHTYYRNSPRIHAALSSYGSAPRTPTLLSGLRSVTTLPASVCPSTTFNRTHESLNLAAYLLSLPSTRYVCVPDAGVISRGPPYDTHGDHVTGTFHNLTATLRTLSSLLAARPPALHIDSRTLVVITTEFGRTPMANAGRGRDHWPSGYTSALLGTTVGGFAGRTLVGRIGDDGRAVGRSALPASSNPVASTPFVTATDLRAALLLALGINPFAPGNFALGSLSHTFRRGSERDAALALRDIVLGYNGSAA